MRSGENANSGTEISFAGWLFEYRKFVGVCELFIAEFVRGAGKNSSRSITSLLLAAECRARRA
jgi:hypothetical protein